MKTQSYDFIAVGAHADDLEMGMGGTIAKMASQGYHGLLVDLTNAGAATRGNAEIRWQESQQAAKILGVDRINLNCTDAQLQNDKDKAISDLVALIRNHQAKVIFAPVAHDYHPDHEIAHQICREAWYKSGLGALWPDLPRHRPRRIFYYSGALSPQEAPSFMVNIDSYWDQRQQAIKAYYSQFDTTNDLNRPQTAVSSLEFQSQVDARHRYWGNLARCTWAEAFWSELPPVLEHPLTMEGKIYG